MNISGIVLTKNEERDITRCLESLSFCDEIVVIDDESTDNTVQIAEKHKSKVFKRKLSSDFSGQRNFILDKVKGDWLLFVDADEVVTPELKEEIKKTVNNTTNNQSVYYIKRRDIWWGKPVTRGEVRKAFKKGIIRLVRKNSGRWYGSVHEEFRAHGSAGRLNGYLDHFAHDSIKSFLMHINTYSSIRATELWKSGKKSNILELIFYPFGKFFYTYVLLLGFLDGVGGFTYSFMMSFHSFLVRAKLYQYENEEPN